MRAYLLLLFVLGAGILEIGQTAAFPDRDARFEAFLEEIRVNIRARDWATVGHVMTLPPRLVPFQIGDLAPCPSEHGRWLLVVAAVRDGEELYRHEQPFSIYDGANFDPSREWGMNRDRITACRLTIGAAVGGSEYYAELGPDFAVIDVDWNIVDSKRRVKDFYARLTMKPGTKGTVDVGDGCRLRWSLDRIESSEPVE
jgi:hypothetical protein